MYRINLISIFIVLFLFSCNNAKIESTRSENEELQKQIDSLKKELNTYKNSPDKLCANIDLLYKNRLKDSLANIKDILTKYHPESPFVDKVSKYIEQILSTEREEKIKAEKERLLAVTKLRKKYDDIQNVTWYYNPYFTHYNDINS